MYIGDFLSKMREAADHMDKAAALLRECVNDDGHWLIGTDWQQVAGGMHVMKFEGSTLRAMASQIEQADSDYKAAMVREHGTPPY